MKDFLEETQIIDFKNEEVFGLAQELAKDCKSDEEIAKNCFLYVRDNIHHSGDFKDEITTYKASDVLKYNIVVITRNSCCSVYVWVISYLCSCNYNFPAFP